MRIIPAVILAIVAVSACTAYQPSGFTGGFSETRLSDRSYQIRFAGNGFTSEERAAEFLLRRAAELTLESGHRYFTLKDPQSDAGWDGWTKNPSGQAILTFLEDPAEAEIPMDAVVVVRETDERAGGRLSPAARQALRELTD